MLFVELGEDISDPSGDLRVAMREQMLGEGIELGGNVLPSTIR